MIYAAVIVLFNKDGEVLLVKRSHAVETFKGHWCFPGGGADEGETSEACAVRETREETSLKVNPSDLIYFYTVVKDSDKDIDFYIAKKWKGKVKIDWESSDYQWIKPSKLKDVKFLPTPLIVFDLLVEWARQNDM
jgi:mutator protein MutT